MSTRTQFAHMNKCLSTKYYSWSKMSVSKWVCYDHIGNTGRTEIRIRCITYYRLTLFVINANSCTNRIFGTRFFLFVGRIRTSAPTRIHTKCVGVRVWVRLSISGMPTTTWCMHARGLTFCFRVSLFSTPPALR